MSIYSRVCYKFLQFYNFLVLAFFVILLYGVVNFSQHFEKYATHKKRGGGIRGMHMYVNVYLCKVVYV